MELGDGGIDNAVNTPPASIKNGSGDADTLDDKDETLASATGPITQEHINFARVYNVIFTVCADALRDILQSQVPTGYTTIYKAFLGNKAMLTGMRQIRREQLQVIFPDPRFRYTGTVDQFNITLLYALIKIISSCPAPITGWGKPPTDQPRDVSLSASVERVRRIRNTVIGHSVDGKLDEKACKDYFGEISQILDDVEAVLGDKGYKGALEDHRKRVIAPRDSMVLRQQFKRLQLKGKIL